MKVKIDLSQDGLAMFFKPYEILGWDVVWNAPEPIGSGEVFRKVLEALGPEKTISRTSVIYFLNRQVNLEFMAWKDTMGKGGHSRLYYPTVTRLELLQTVLDYSTEKITQLLQLVGWAHG